MKVIQDGGSPIKMWTDGVPVEDQAVEQLLNISRMPFIHKHVAVMPDVHLGKGATVGSVIATHKAIIPAAVGVDIGCGMQSGKLNIKAEQLPDNLSAVRAAIEKAVPHGRTDNGGRNDRGAWGTSWPDAVAGMVSDGMVQTWNGIVNKHPKIEKGNLWNHLSTLGSGNHFIEFCVDTEGGVWYMLHTGSRGPGNRIGQYFIEKAKEDMERYFIHLPDKDLSYLAEGSLYFNDYIQAVSWAQSFAQLSRDVMANRVVMALKESLGIPDLAVVNKAINCHHNYISEERHYGENVWVTRKGAVSARSGQLGIIPGSMGAKSFIVRGKGNHESFHSCSHGAGRKMSRTEAKKRFTVEDQIKATEGVECRKDADVIDEIPMAYKSIDDVMAAQSDLVEIVAQLKQVLCVKG
jgi:tRNA-splicing ligase RtcB